MHQLDQKWYNRGTESKVPDIYGPKKLNAKGIFEYFFNASEEFFKSKRNRPVILVQITTFHVA